MPSCRKSTLSSRPGFRFGFLLLHHDRASFDRGSGTNGTMPRAGLLNNRPRRHRLCKGRLHERLRRYQVPVFPLGRLAVSPTVQGRGLGGDFLLPLVNMRFALAIHALGNFTR